MDVFKEKLSSMLAIVLGLLILFVLGTGLWAQRGWFPLIGGAFLLDLGIALVLSPFFIFFLILAWVNRGHYIESGMQGGYLRNAFGKTVPLPPLSPVTPKVAGTKVTEIAPDIPRLGELIASGTLTSEEDGKPVMLQGFRVDGTARYGAWPGVVAIIGMQNVGKTITMVSLIIIALLQGARVVVCDTHHTKARSLYKKIQALDKYITFALTEQEVLRETKRFAQELQARKRGSTPYPYIIFYDELCSLIRARQVEELKEVIPTTMDEASQEGHGFNLHLVASIHDISNAGIGDARLRSFWNWVYCHRMESGQSKFIEIFKGRYGQKKASLVIASLPSGHVMARDEANTMEYLVMPNGDSRDALVALKKLEELALPRPGEPARVSPAPARLPIREQLAEHASFSPGYVSPERASSQAQNSVNAGETIDTVNMVKEPGPELDKPSEIGETRIVEGETFTVKLSPVSPSQELAQERAQASEQEPIAEGKQALTPAQKQETAILRAYWELQNEQATITRQAIQQRLGWNNRSYPIIKRVCDKYSLASR